MNKLVQQANTIESQTNTIEALKSRIKELEGEKEDREDDFIDAEHDRLDAIEDLQRVQAAILEAIELTRRDGPMAGMERLAAWLDEAPGHIEPRVPYDWLSRWVEGKVA